MRSRDAGSAGRRGPDGRLARWLGQFMAASSWERSFRLLDRHPELAQERAEALLGELIESARSSGDRETADQWDYYRTVLRRCRVLGRDRVFRELTSAEDDDRLITLASRAAAAYRRYGRHGNLEDIEAAIRDGEAVIARAIAIPTRVAALSNLGLALTARADHRGSPGDADRAVAILDEAASLTPPGEPERLSYLINLGMALLTRYELGGEDESLDRAVAVLTAEASGAAPDGAPVLLLNLGSALYNRFRRDGADDDLDSAIQLFADAAALAPPSGGEQARTLNNLGVALSDRYQRTGNHQDLDRAVAALEQAVALAPPASPARPAQLGHLASALIDRYDRSGRRDDLDRAVATATEAAEMTPAGSAERPARDAAVGTVLIARYELDGDLADLDRAIAAHEQAVRGTPASSPDLPLYLDQLGTSVRARARLLSEALRRTGADLDELRRLDPARARAYQVAADRVSALESAAMR
jgi:Tetratricopeptide repeat